MEQATLDYINGLPISDEDKRNLITAIEWEKEISWSEGYQAGYTDAVDSHEINTNE